MKKPTGLQTYWPTNLIMKPSVKKLKNGMTVLLEPVPGAPSMTIFAYCRVGSRYETGKINGASHFIEHLMFKGTKRRPNAQILSQELDRFGANFNAMTSKDYTGYYIKIDAHEAASAVDLLHDMLFHSKFDPKEIERERGVIIEEINMYEDNPKMRIDYLLESALFPNSTLGWDVAGPRRVIRSISRQDLVTYRDAYYIPERFTIVLAGKLPSNAVKLLASTFGKVKSSNKRGDEEFKRFRPLRAIKDPLAAEEKKTEQTQVGIGFYGYPYGHEHEPAAALCSIILGGYMSSRLFVQVRERKGLCYSISAAHEPLEDTGIFSIYAGLDRRRLPLAIRTIISEFKKVMKNDVTAAELRRAKDHIRGKLALAFEDSSFRASWYGKQWMFRGTTKTPKERMAELDAVTRADVVRVAKAMFYPETMARAVIGPNAGRGTLDKIFKWE
jgi:predicted Zn-dependent peptidase